MRENLFYKVFKALEGNLIQLDNLHQINTFIKFSNSIITSGGAVAWWLRSRTPEREVGFSSPTQVAVLCP